MENINKIKEYWDLKESGILTDAEYKEYKCKFLTRSDTGDVLELLKAYSDLLKSGLISDGDFAEKKSNILGISPSSSAKKEETPAPQPVDAPVPAAPAPEAVPVATPVAPAQPKEKKPIPKKLLIAIGAVVAVALIAFVLLQPKDLVVENMMLYVGEAAMPEFSGEGLDKTAIESYEYSFDQENIITVTSDNKLLVEEDFDDSIECTLKVKAGNKKWKGTFYISSSYKAVDFENGDMPIGTHSGRCPLKIENLESGQICYVYFKSNDGGEDFAILIDGGESVSKTVGTGSYTMYVAYGYVTQDWYGTKYLFGADGNSYYKRDKALEFTMSSSSANGFTISMVDGTGGAVDLKSITYSDFPKK